MTRVLKSIAKNLTPPLFLNAAISIANFTGLRTVTEPEHAERDSAWYNADYEGNLEYRKHYSGSRYYFLWTVVGDRLLRGGAQSVLDIGCGAGQVASFLKDKGVRRYIGLDLSDVAIRRAKSICPEYDFRAGSVFDTDLVENAAYDAAISLEFLEHVDDDLGVVRRVPKGRRFLGSVPNFPYASHVRHFQRAEEVADRYGRLFAEFHVDAFFADEKRQTFFLFDGVRA
ncbi:MAG: methyltransferase domain-containing protein [Thermoguttaceae bacterium]